MGDVDSSQRQLDPWSERSGLSSLFLTCKYLSGNTTPSWISAGLCLFKSKEYSSLSNLCLIWGQGLQQLLWASELMLDSEPCMKEVLRGNNRTWSSSGSDAHHVSLDKSFPSLGVSSFPCNRGGSCTLSGPHKEPFAVWRAEIPNGIINATLPLSIYARRVRLPKMSTEHNNNENLGSHCLEVQVFSIYKSGLPNSYL